LDQWLSGRRRRRGAILHARRCARQTVRPPAASSSPDQSGRRPNVRQFRGRFVRRGVFPRARRLTARISSLRPVATLVPSRLHERAISKGMPILYFSSTNPALADKVSMLSPRERHFARRFDEIWQCSPFHPSAAVGEFLARFMRRGNFDAESFWEFVSVRQPKRPPSISVPRASRRRC